MIDSSPQIRALGLVSLTTMKEQMKNILCVVDLGEGSEKVLKVAADLANASKAHLIIIFPYRLIDPDHGSDMNALKKRLESEATGKFQGLKHILPALRKVAPEFHSEIGFAVSRINAHLRKDKIDTVILGEHQVKGSNNQNNGDLEKLISTSRIPFIIVPPSVGSKRVFNGSEQLNTSI